ncbi:MAG: CcmD family protein [Gemmatimonadota bacterium]|nr:CcmD family protein [Gemmatimonadota bacterium]HEU4989344.1 CcmD family protein [Gemmatimonadaceae bacterium]
MEASNWAYVTAAYAVTWVLVLGYMAYARRALQRARAEYRRVTGHEPGEGDAV